MKSFRHELSNLTSRKKRHDYQLMRYVVRHLLDRMTT
nr:MAG TPA: hypothetical protein [Caudoviricetes sp.]